MKLLRKRSLKKFTLVLIQEMYITLDGMLVLKLLILEILNDSFKQRKLSSNNDLFRRDPVMAKTKMVSERLLMQSMADKGFPY